MSSPSVAVCFRHCISIWYLEGSSKRDFNGVQARAATSLDLCVPSGAFASLQLDDLHQPPTFIMNTIMGMYGSGQKTCLVGSLFVILCPIWNCKQKPAYQGYDYCGKTCADWARANPPAAARAAPSQPPEPPKLREVRTSSAMAGPTNSGSFRGDSWEECSAFIQGVRNAAWEEGKIRDQAWMADFASIHLSAKALAWYARLPRDVQEDWSKLQEALVAQWSTSDDQAGPQNVPATPSAQSPRDEENLGWSDSGILKAIMEGSDSTYYVWRPTEDGDFSLTEDASHAARFRFHSGSSSKLLEYVDGPWYSWLAIHWRQSSPNIGRGSINYADLSIVDSETMRSSRGNEGPFQLAMCKVSQSSELTFTWRDGNTGAITYITFHSTILIKLQSPRNIYDSIP
ncbi:hypothetical protein FS837_009669 [Tulasnella sp. UAMH 9824]|nr:hypothetical protein FS837_009669 [Tulasnella sp. UAMH 9824]